MAETTKKAPAIRFDGFTDDWEQHTLCDEFERVNERNDGSFGINHWISVAKMYFQDPSKVTSNNLDTRTYVMRTGDIAFEGHPNTEFQFGRFVANDIGDGIISELFPIYRHRTGYYNSYWKYAIQIEQIMRPIYAKAITSSGASSNKLNEEHFLREKIRVPSYDEQVKIGDFLKRIDNNIALHQHKYDMLMSIKKSCLEKMFPKAGSTVPEFRFTGFKNAWEQRKLSDVLEIVANKNGDTYSKENVLSVSDEYGCVNQIKLQGRSFAGEDISNYKIVESGNIIYTRSPLRSKPYGIIKVVGEETGIVSPLYIVNKPKTGYDSQFLYRVFDSPEKTNNYLSPLVRKGAKNTMNISNDEWLSGEICIAPSFEEQKIIGEYFRNLDNLITLHQRKCEKLKAVKKSLLQKMFV